MGDHSTVGGGSQHSEVVEAQHSDVSQSTVEWARQDTLQLCVALVGVGVISLQQQCQRIHFTSLLLLAFVSE